MARNASVSVIIPTWNEAKYLPALLDSLQNQTRSPLEILIADSESTDGTQDLAEARGALLVPGDRRGPGEGRNRGARAARGDVFLFVDADCITPPDLLDAIVAAFEEPGVIGGATGFMPALGNAAERALFSLANGYQRAMTLWGFPHNAGYCFFFRREAFQTLGGLREDMPLNETHDLALRSPAPDGPDVDAALPDVRLRPHDPEGIHRLDDPVLRDGPHVRRTIPPGARPLTEPGYRALRPRPRRR